MDLVYYESPPGLQLLHCTRFDEEVQGGASTFLDCFEMAEVRREASPAPACTLAQTHTHASPCHQLFRQRQPKHFETLCRVPATLQKIHTKRAVPVHIVYQRPHIDVNSRGEVFKAHLERLSALVPQANCIVPLSLAPLPPIQIVALHWSPPFEGPLRVPEEDVEPYYDAYVAFCNLMREETPKRCVGVCASYWLISCVCGQLVLTIV